MPREPISCPACHGEGFEFSATDYARTCERCNGDGRIVPELPIDPHRCACGLRYTEEEWCALDCPGVLQFETGYCVELRQCHCASTLARVLYPVTAQVQEYLDGQRGRDAA